MKILFVRQPQENQASLNHWLAEAGFQPFYCSQPGDCYSQIRLQEIRTIILDLNSENDDFSLLKSIKQFDPILDVILVGDPLPPLRIAEALRLGAREFLPRPLDKQALLAILERIRAKSQLKQETYQLERALQAKYIFQGMVGKNPQMLEIFSLIERVAPYPVSLLISGETGTGKEMVARAIHELSPRQPKNFVVADCTAIPETLFESELFGYVRGAFTGADRNKRGLFEEADGGTVFLDEISEIPLTAQAKLLRVLQDQRFQSLGSTRKVQVDVRVIAATNRDLRMLISHSQFREDLYQRLNVIEIMLPPLRERKEDITLLAYSFLEKFNKKFGKAVRGISQQTQKMLIQYPWPGNVRELEHVIERATMLTQNNFINVGEMPDSLKNFQAATAFPFAATTIQNLDALEKNHIIKVLEQVKYNKQQAAKILGLNRPALYRKLKRHSIK